jgi:hypothetical protein
MGQSNCGAELQHCSSGLWMYISRLVTNWAFSDNKRMFAARKQFDFRVKAEGAPQHWAEQALGQPWAGIRSAKADL